jgi:nucleoid-associated protein YgaU
MSRETKFGLLLVCVLTSVFGVLVYKRMHKPADLVAGTDHDPAAVAISDNYPTDTSTEPTQFATESSPATEPQLRNEMLAVAPSATQPQSAPVTTTFPAEESDPFAPTTSVAQVTPAKPNTTRLPTNLDDDFFSASTKASTPRSAPVSVESLPAQSEPDPFATEPSISAGPGQPAPAETFTAKSAPPAQEAEFDPFATPPAITTSPAAKPVTAAPVETEADPFAQEPPQTEPVTTSSRSTTVVAEPASEVRTFEPGPVPVAKPMPVTATPATDSFSDPFAAPESRSAPITIPAPKQPVLPPAVVIDIPENKTASTNDDPLLLDPLDAPPARIVTPVPSPVTRQPQALPVDSVDVAFTAQEVNLGSQPAVGQPRGIDFDFNPTTATELSGTQGYVVEPGDNFWTISRKLYGTGKFFQALATHNAPIVADPAKLKPGQRIAAPSVAELDLRYATLLAPTGTSSTAKPVQSVGFFVSEAGQPMYRVGTDDTLSSIAYGHLGRASRWVQIYELNRHALKDGNTLKVGAELRLPADASQVQMMGGAGMRR